MKFDITITTETTAYPADGNSQPMVKQLQDVLYEKLAECLILDNDATFVDVEVTE